MTSYQKLKKKYIEAKHSLDLFKNALTIVKYEPSPMVADIGSLADIAMFSYRIIQNQISEEAKEELTRWVAFNIDEDSLMHLLKIKKELENGNQRNQ